jgi:hypothetical protein
MTIDINIFNVVRLYFAIMCPWITSKQKQIASWEYFSLHLTQEWTRWSLGWTLDSDYRAFFLGPWTWEKDLELK